MNRLFSPDARLLDLPIWPRRLTDAEYIERVRKHLGMQRWLRIVCGVIIVGIIFLAVWTIQLMLGFVWQWGGPQVGPMAGFLVAMLLGFSVGWMFMGFAHGAVTMIVESRRDRLLVESWDLLQQLIAERGSTESSQVQAS